MHPKSGMDDSPLSTILSLMGGLPASINATKDLGIKLNSYGVKNGWANWPFNFDPIWIDSCNGFEEK